MVSRPEEARLVLLPRRVDVAVAGQRKESPVVCAVFFPADKKPARTVAFQDVTVHVLDDALQGLRLGNQQPFCQIFVGNGVCNEPQV